MKSKLIGAGLIAGATWVAYNRLSEPTPFDSPYADAASQILIVGGGFGGLAAARELGHALGGRQDVGVALLDRVNYTTFWPLVPSTRRALYPAYPQALRSPRRRVPARKKQIWSLRGGRLHQH